MPLNEIKIHQIRAARSLLDWTQDDLAERSGISKYSVTNIEGGRTEPQKATLDRIIRSLEMAGIEFIEDGVRLHRNTATILQGDNWFSDFLDDVRKTLEHAPIKELLIFGGNNSLTPSPIYEKFKAIREGGVRIREMVKDGDTYLMGPEEDYRWIPESHYHNNLTIVYGDKVLNDFTSHALLMNNPDWARVERSKFELIWSLCKTPPNGCSTAKERY